MTNETEIPEVIGSINMSEEVIATVAGVAAVSVQGVKGMSSTIASGIAERLGKKSVAKGVKVEINENETKIALSLVVEYGCRIPDVAWEVQEKVKREVESMTSLNVVAVDVYVNSISFETAQPEAKK